jgi:hypothetical protein
MQRTFLVPLALLLGLLASLLLGLLMLPFVDKRPVGAQEEQAACPPADQASVGIWGTARLEAINTCQRASGTVLKAEPELDGDLDLYVDLDSEYYYLAGTQVELDFLHQWAPGDVIVELMPRDGEHLPAPSEGDHIDLTGAWVKDTNHGYNEIHPVWSESINGGEASTSGPENGGSLPQSTAQTAAADCTDGDDAPCIGYSG